MGKSRYHANGFIPVNFPPARRYMPAAIVNIVKGDVLHYNGAGFATNATVAFAATCLGVAAADCDNSGGAAGDLNVEYYPLDTNTQYIVPVAQTALITTTARGSMVDLENNDDIDLSDTVTEGIGFLIDEIDASADAILGNAFGYAIGHFVITGTQAP